MRLVSKVTPYNVALIKQTACMPKVKKSKWALVAVAALSTQSISLNFFHFAGIFLYLSLDALRGGRPRGQRVLRLRRGRRDGQRALVPGRLPRVGRLLHGGEGLVEEEMIPWHSLTVL